LQDNDSLNKIPVKSLSRFMPAGVQIYKIIVGFAEATALKLVLKVV
jgi:hypothetical protein